MYQKLKVVLKNPLSFLTGWVYGAYLTLRYVDEYKHFPAIIFRKVIPLNIRKGKNAKLTLQGRLFIEPWLNASVASSIDIGDNAECRINGDFIIGDDVRIYLYQGARLTIEGRQYSTGSGITCKGVVLAYQHVSIGYDTIIAWDTLITDCDWHTIEGQKHYADTTIGNHVWIAAGCKILKGVTIGDNSIIAAQSVVTSGIYPAQVLLGGLPAIILKTSIPSWSRSLT